MASVGLDTKVVPGMQAEDEALRLREDADARGRRLSAARLWGLLAFVFLNGVLFNCGVVLVNQYLVFRHAGVDGPTSFSALESFLIGDVDTDSLDVMLPTLHLLENSIGVSPYQQIFFENHEKLQYPLTSLLPLYVLQKFGMSDDLLAQVWNIAIWLSVCGTIGLAFLIALRFSAGQLDWRAKAVLALSVGLAGLLFYPLMWGYALGQIQTVLTFGFAIAFYCWMRGREKTAGVAMGLLMLVKPQYSLFLLWALLRKRFGALTSSLACVGAGVLASCLFFGFHNNLDYLRVLRVISQHGENFAANQSVNGILNRLISNGNSLEWSATQYAPYHALVYYGTLLSSLALIAFVLFFKWGERRKAGAADFACFVLASTMASPVAWEHHYGILLPIFSWLWAGGRFVGVGGRMSQLYVMVLALAYVLTSDNLLPVASLAFVPVLNVLQSYVYAGAALVVILLIKSSVPEPVKL